MENSYKYFKNEDCQYYPCHRNMQGESFNCLFCFCPMNPYADCLGAPAYIVSSAGNRIKDCSGCTFPHEPQHYEAIMEFLRSKCK
ncbi:metal-binding protein [Lachnospiraceae bacterium]|nr:metal-binding protein [Lachnospiraceae bacterium]